MTQEQLVDAKTVIETARRPIAEVANEYRVHPRTLARLLRQQAEFADGS